MREESLLRAFLTDRGEIAHSSSWMTEFVDGDGDGDGDGVSVLE